MTKVKKNYFILVITIFFTTIAQSQCIIGNDNGSFDPQNNFDWAQSFTAECDGFLEYVEFITGTGGTQQARTLEIFEGATVTGLPIYTQAFPLITFDSQGGRLRIVLEEFLPIIEGDEYTFQIPGVTVNLQVSINNPYSGGFAFENGAEFNQIVDFVFNVSIVDQPLAINEFSITSIKAFPNPTTEIITIDIGQNTQQVQLAIYNVLGVLVQQEQASNTERLEANVSNLNTGIYFAVITAEGHEGTLQFIKS